MAILIYSRESYSNNMTKEIIVDPKIRVGKPTIKGTRITVDEVVGALVGFPAAAAAAGDGDMGVAATPRYREQTVLGDLASFAAA